MIEEEPAGLLGFNEAPALGAGEGTPHSRTRGAGRTHFNEAPALGAGEGRCRAGADRRPRKYFNEALALGAGEGPVSPERNLSRNSELQ